MEQWRVTILRENLGWSCSLGVWGFLLFFRRGWGDFTGRGYESWLLTCRGSGPPKYNTWPVFIKHFAEHGNYLALCGRFPYYQGGGNSSSSWEADTNTERLKEEEPPKNTGSRGNKRPQAPGSLHSHRKLPDGHLRTFKACKVPPTVGLACGDGPRPLLKPCIVPPPLALPRKRRKSKESGVAQNYTPRPHRRLGASQIHQKKQPEWQHQSSADANRAEHKQRGTSVPRVRD